MKKQYTLSIDKPCSENWNNFNQTAAGGFCSECMKNVVDFTTMSDQELVNFISESSGQTCGRLRRDQLSREIKSAPLLSRTNTPWQFIKTGVAGLSLVIFTNNGMANGLIPKNKTNTIQLEKESGIKKPVITNSRTLSGIVIDEYGDSLPGVNVVIKGTSDGTITDYDGKFKLEVSEGDVLVFSFIGLETKEYKVDKREFADVELKMEMKMCDYIFMGELAVEEVYASKPSGLKGFWTKVKSLF